MINMLTREKPMLLHVSVFLTTQNNHKVEFDVPATQPKKTVQHMYLASISKILPTQATEMSKMILVKRWFLLTTPTHLECQEELYKADEMTHDAIFE